jgi:hypothetical protein
MLGAMGVMEAVRTAGIQPGDTLRVANVELEWGRKQP